MSAARVAITIVTFGSARYIAGCLEQALAQDHQPLEIVVVDNDSKDETREILRTFEERAGIRVAYNATNVGFAAGQNQAMALAGAADWYLVLNPDVRLDPQFVSELLKAVEGETAVGSVCGKLIGTAADFKVSSPALLDSTGIYFTPSLRHFDRGNRLPDEGQYNTCEYVFGATGAACLYRRSMVEDASVFGEFFDTDFFAYREDADLAWRAQLLGWKCLYTPCATALHVRTVVPENRRSLPAVINMHSVKNRWLMRMKNMTPDLYRRHWLAITWRDVMVIGGCLLREWSSLRAFVLVAQLYGKMKAKRREIMRRRRATDGELAAWFQEYPTSQPIGLELRQPGAES